MTRILAPVLALLILLGAHSARAADCANPTRSEGTIVYNADAHVMQYCDGTEWVGMGPKAYVPVAVTFDGTSDYLTRGADLTSVSDDKEASGAFWFRRNGGTGAIRVIYSNTNARFEVSFTAANTLRILGKNAANATILDLNTTATYTDASWHHVLFSFDLAEPSRRHIYVDGVVQALTITTFTNDTIDFTTGNVSVGATTAGGTKYIGDMADFWLETGLYLDLTVSTTRQKFVTSSIKPVSLGSTGALPTGSQPDIFLSGALASWHTNDGTGGGFTVNGGLTAAAYAPGGGTADTTSNLLSRWKLDEGSGNAIGDSSGNGYNAAKGTGTSWSATGGPAGGVALSFDGTANAWADIAADPAALQFTTSFTISTWVKLNALGGHTFFGRSDGNADGYGFGTFSDCDGTPAATRLSLALGDAGVGFFLWCATSALSTGTWYHAAAVYDSAAGTVKTYLNGVDDGGSADSYWGTTTVPTPSFNTTVNGPPTLGASGGNYTGNLNGSLSDLRIYNRALSAQDVIALYLGVSSACANPSGAEGEMFYNADRHILQYCDGFQWRKTHAGIYTPNAVTFDGTNDYLTKNGSSITGSAGSQQATGSFWFRRNGGNGTKQVIFSTYRTTLTNIRFEISLSTANRIQIQGRDNGITAGTTRLNVTSGAQITDTDWHHVMFSFDLANAANRAIYIDGALDTPTWSTYSSVNNIRFDAGTLPNNAVGAIPNGTSKLNGDLADLWIQSGLYTDLSVAANRQKFISAAGRPVYLGDSGEVPTGTAPKVFFSGGTSTWHTNDGTGGGFTEVGALTDAASYPGAPPGTGCADPDKPEGAIVYHTDHHKLAYCNGWQWMPVGK